MIERDITFVLTRNLGYRCLLIRKKVAHSRNNPTANRTVMIEPLLINTSDIYVYSKTQTGVGDILCFLSEGYLKMLGFKEFIIVEDIKNRRN